MAAYVYMMSSQKDGPLYTASPPISRRGFISIENGEGSAFCKRYGLTCLVYAETHDRIEDAIAREKQIKKWRCAWKVKLIEDMNPDWRDLFETIMQ